MTPGFFERLGTLIWKIKHHDEIVISLERDLEEAQDKIEELKLELEKAKEKER